VTKIRTIFIGDTTEEAITFEPGPNRFFNGWHLGFGLVTDVTWDDDVRAQLLGQRPDPFEKRVTLIRKGKFCALIRARLGNAPCD
jgi:hypothetical protein